VACDGEIVEGRSALDESAVTGESVPVARGPGEKVVAGSINADGRLCVRVTRDAADNTVARIVHLVEEASASRAPSQRFVERFARWWTPVALAAALLVMLAPPLLFDGDWWTWTYHGLALLLIACPCALVISVPAAVASGLSAGARRGLLVKGGAALEAIGAARTVAFDKTGTLTEGRLRVTDFVPLGTEADAGRVLAQAAAVEEGSSHPLARAITAAAKERGIASAGIGRAGRSGAGGGGQCRRAAGRSRQPAPCHRGRPGLAADAAACAEALEAEGKTVVVVLVDGAPLGLIAMRDEPREDASAGIAALRGLGVETVMLTGDNERTGRAIAGALGMDVRAGLLPEDKLREIAALQANGPVVMVGASTTPRPWRRRPSAWPWAAAPTWRWDGRRGDHARAGRRRGRARRTVTGDACQHPPEHRRRRGTEAGVPGDDGRRPHRAMAGHHGGYGCDRAGDAERAPAAALAACDSQRGVVPSLLSVLGYSSCPIRPSPTAQATASSAPNPGGSWNSGGDWTFYLRGGLVPNARIPRLATLG